MLKELILISYLLCMVMSVSGFTIAWLSWKKSRSRISRNAAFFLIGLLAICCYDMAIYYTDYVLGAMSNLRVLRLGNCIIAGNMYLWTVMQEGIIKREALTALSKMVKRYQLFYIALWLILTLFLSVEQFYTIKWLLLATDIALIIVTITVSVGHIIFAATLEKKFEFYYILAVTTMIIMNYITYFWSATSVFWGNSEFIREPMDFTVIFWLGISVITLIYEYREEFTKIFGRASDEDGGKRNLQERIGEVCEKYRLTPREKEFIELIYSGKSNKEIADILFLSESTVKTHIYNIFRKMDVKNRVGIIYIVNEEENKAQSRTSEIKPDVKK